MDWWQAFLLFPAGGLISGVTAYFTHRLTTSASREAEERHAKRRLAEEQRQAIRHFRRERIQPVLDWLDIVKQSAGREIVSLALDKYRESLSAEDKLSPERLERVRDEFSKIYPDIIQETRAFSIATWASLSVPGLPEELLTMYGGLRAEGDAETLSQLGPALRSAEQLLEQYLAGAEPHEPSADNPSQEA